MGRFEYLRGGFPLRWESVGFCPIDASIQGWQGLPSGVCSVYYVVEALDTFDSSYPRSLLFMPGISLLKGFAEMTGGRHSKGAEKDQGRGGMVSNLVENRVLSPEAKEAAATIEQRLELGSKLSDIVKTKTDAHALLDLYKNQGYILTPRNGKVCVILKDVCTPQDMLKSMFHVSYLYWLEKNVGLTSIGVFDDCGPGECCKYH
ncbi:protein root UVB sensitive 1, chloroplastic [Tanacetum coccineum]